MTFYQTHLRKAIISLLLFSAIACESEKIEPTVVAQVNGSILTEVELSMALANTSNQFNEDEFIRNWIEDEVLFQEAMKENLLNDSVYLNVIETAKKNLAVSLFINRSINKNKEISSKELRDYYRTNKKEFILYQNAYIINIAYFKNRHNAQIFRNEIIDYNWQTVSKKDNIKGLQFFEENKFIKRSEIQPKHLLRSVDNLYPKEVSIVLKTEPDLFAVVQLIKKFKKGQAPSLKYINQKVTERYLMVKNKKDYNDLLEELISKNNVSIQRN